MKPTNLMHKKILITLAVLVILVPGLALAEKAFIVRPGGVVQGASFGMKSGNLTYFGGLDFLMISVNGSYSEQDFGPDYEWDPIDYEWDLIEGSMYLRSDRTVDMDGSAKLFVPHLGVRYALGTDSVRPYAQLSLFHVVPFVSLSGSETTTDFNSAGQITDVDVDEFGGTDLDEASDKVKDILDAWGFTLGFGSEYYFSEKFSLGGEFGMRYARFSLDGEYTDDSDPEDEYKDVWKSEASTTFGVTYASFSLNYYF